MRKKVVYLAGLMTGLTVEEAMQWRYDAKRKLRDSFKMFPSDYTFNTYVPEFDPELDETGKEIWNRDYYYVDNSDVLLVNFDYDNQRPYLGTSMEIARAFYQNKPIIIFSNQEWVHNNKTLNYHATKIVNTIDEAIKYIKNYYY